MELDELRAFVAVAETGSVSAAAARLHLTQPAISRRLQRLEAALGVALFDRQTKPLAITPAGRAVLDQSRRILQSVDELRLTVNHEPAGEFRLGVSLTFEALALAQPIDQVRKAFLRVALEVTTGWSPALVDQLQAGALEMAFVVQVEGDRLSPHVTGRLLGREPLVFIAPSHARLHTVEPERLAEWRWVVNPEGCGCRRALQHALHRASVPFLVAVEVYGWDLQLSLVARGAGLALLPASILRRSRLRSRVRPFRVQGLEFELELWAVRGRPLGTLEPVAAALADALAARTGPVRAFTDPVSPAVAGGS